MPSEANHIKAGTIVVKAGRYYPNQVKNERAYIVWVGGKQFYAEDTALLADKVAAYLDSLDKKGEAK